MLRKEIRAAEENQVSKMMEQDIQVGTDADTVPTITIRELRNTFHSLHVTFAGSGRLFNDSPDLEERHR